jgi:hypothetical protein
MPNQIVLAWTVDVENSSFGPAQAATALAAVPLYDNPDTDPVLGQLFGLSVETDATTSDATSATRTLTLNMFKASDSNPAPPSFPCHPRTSTPPTLPYPLRESVTLVGSFFCTNGSLSVDTTESQVPGLSVGDSVQFLRQEGVFYEVASVGATSIGLTAAYSGVTGNTEAFKEIAAPVTIAAVFSTSEFDTAGVATVPAIAAGPGARTLLLEYTDSNGVSDGVSISLTGRRPAAITLAPGTVDIAEIVALTVTTTGAFENSVGQITLVGLSSALPAIPSNATPDDFAALTDEAQLLIDRAIVYLPPSYFSLAQQGATRPYLEGDFILTTGSRNVPTTADQTGALSPGDVIQFAEQLQRNTRSGKAEITYTVDEVSEKLVQLTTPFTGIDNNNTGTNQVGTNANAGTQGNLGTKLNAKASAAFRVSPTPAGPPTNDELAAPLGQFVALETAAPPPNPPLSPATVPAPTFLSGYFTRTLQLALAGVPITSATITFA